MNKAIRELIQNARERSKLGLPRPRPTRLTIRPNIAAAEMGLTMRICWFCGNEFYVTEEMLRSRPCLYCSNPCKRAGAKENAEALKVQVRCDTCQQLFARHMDLVEKSGKHFCSKFCANVYRGMHGAGTRKWTPELLQEMAEHQGENCAVHGCDSLKTGRNQWNVCSRHNATIHSSIISARSRREILIAENFSESVTLEYPTAEEIPEVWFSDQP